MPDPSDDIALSQEQLDQLDPHIRDALNSSSRLKHEKAEAEARATQLERELAFTKAGIPDTPLTTTLAKTYAGENDPTAIRAYFEGLGVEITGTSAGTPQQPTPAPQGATPAELEAQRQLAEVGSQGGMGGDVDFGDAMKSASTQAELLALVNSAPQGSGIGPVEIQ
jgi:hypothetical protein